MELSNYLEKIRYGRKLTQEDFVDGVVSLRQYQRYRSGECEIPYEKLQQFSDKLGIPSRKLLNEFEKKKQEQLNAINEYYNVVVNKDLQQADKYRTELKQDIIIEEETQVYYRHATILHDYNQDKLSKTDAAHISAKLIDYPKILKQDYFTDIEVLVLSSLLTFLNVEQQQPILERLSELFDKQTDIITIENDIIYTMILMRLSKSYGMQKNFPQVIRVCNLGIQRGKRLKRYYLWEYFYYYKALAYFRLEDYVNYEDSLFRCYNVLHMEGNKKKIELFTGYIEKDFNINFHNFVLNYLKKHVV